MARPKDCDANAHRDRKDPAGCRGNCLCEELKRRRAYDACARGKAWSRFIVLPACDKAPSS